MTIDYIRFWLHTALQFIVRSGRTTAALGLMIVTAVSSLIFLSALSVGVNDAMLRNTVGLFSGHISGFELPASISPQDMMREGVSGVLKRIYLPGIISNGKLAQPLILCAVDPEMETSLTSLAKKTTAGRYPKSGQREIFLSKAIARELDAKPGSSLLFSPGNGKTELELIIAGIYETGIESLDRGIFFCPAHLLSEQDRAWTAAVFLKPGISPDAVIENFHREFSDKGRFESWKTLMPDLSQLVDLEYFSMLIVIVLVFGVVSVGIVCIFVIFIIRNLREYGIMKAMGVTSTEMALLIISKVMIMDLIACCVGVVAGVLAVYIVAGTGGIDLSAFTSHNRYFTVSGIILPRLTVFSLVVPPVLAVVFSLAASIWPAALVAGKKPADIIRMI